MLTFRFAFLIGFFAIVSCPLHCPAQEAKEAPPKTDKFVTVYGAKIHYVEAGSGAPLILIHGLADNVAVWDSVIPSLAAKFRAIAQSKDGLSDTPTFTYRQLTGFPIRYGNVCVVGLFCPSDDSRSLLDFTQVEVDKECRANVVFGDNSAYIPWLQATPNGAFREDGTTTDFALQGSKGFRICMPGTGGAGAAGSYTVQK